MIMNKDRRKRLERFWHCGGLFGLLLLQAGCSTTSNLAEGEQLYVGIDKIIYEDSPEARKQLLEKDSIGVIASMGNTAKTFDDIWSGNISRDSIESQWGKLRYKDLSKKERKAISATLDREQKEFEGVKEELEAVLAYPPNNSLFGSSSMKSPLQLGLWTYNKFVNAEHKLGKWIFKRFATQPVYVTTVSPDMRVKVATNTLHNYGYLGGKVDYVLEKQKNPKKSKISYSVYSGPLSYLDSVAYLNFPAQADSLLKSTERRRFLQKGKPFRVIDLANEQTRIEKLFRENGYYYYAAPYTTYRADTLKRPGYVQLQVLPVPERPERVKHPWYIGHAYISVRNHEQEVLDQFIKRPKATFSYAGKKIPLSVPMWYRSIVHRKGKMYRQSDEEYTYAKLNGLDIFSQLDISYMPRDTTNQCDTLDMYITALMDKLYDSSFEMNAVFKSNQQVGPGVSFGLSRRNAFGGGEKVSFKLFGSYEWQTGAGSAGSKSLLNSYELGTELAVDIPRFLLPHFGKRRFRFPASTKFALNADWRNRAGFFNMVTVGANVVYKWNKYKTTMHELTLLSLDFDKMLHTTAKFDSIMGANPALSVSMRDQFIPSMGYTLTYASASSHRNPVWLQVSVKESGNLVSGIYAACGEKWSKRDKNLLKNPFAQYVKLTTEFHETFRLGGDWKLATRFFGGVIYSYGNSTRAPYADQFYVGGANSIRGFTVRTIGPGGYRAENSKYSYIDQTGDFKLELNAELRGRLLGSLHWATFFDMGNVWLLRPDPLRDHATLTAKNLKRMAFGTGVGLRYDLDFLVLRFDIGVPLHAPYETGKSGWYNIPKFGKSLAYHFAIGYPF